MIRCTRLGSSGSKLRSWSGMGVSFPRRPALGGLTGDTCRLVDAAGAADGVRVVSRQAAIEGVVRATPEVGFPFVVVRLGVVAIEVGEEGFIGLAGALVVLKADLVIR
jgi:hypothetical protein